MRVARDGRARRVVFHYQDTEATEGPIHRRDTKLGAGASASGKKKVSRRPLVPPRRARSRRTLNYRLSVTMNRSGEERSAYRDPPPATPPLLTLPGCAVGPHRIRDERRCDRPATGRGQLQES